MYMPCTAIVLRHGLYYVYTYVEPLRTKQGYTTDRTAVPTSAEYYQQERKCSWKKYPMIIFVN